MNVHEVFAVFVESRADKHLAHQGFVSTNDTGQNGVVEVLVRGVTEFGSEALIDLAVALEPRAEILDISYNPLTTATTLTRPIISSVERAPRST